MRTQKGTTKLCAAPEKASGMVVSGFSFAPDWLRAARGFGTSHRAK